MRAEAATGTRIKVKLFGAEAAAVGRSEVVVNLTGTQPTCGDLRAALFEQVGVLRPLIPTLRFAVNHAYAGDSEVLLENDEVAIIGKVSGG